MQLDLAVFSLHANQVTKVQGSLLHCYKKKIDGWLRFLTPVCEIPSLNLHWEVALTLREQVYEYTKILMKHLNICQNYGWYNHDIGQEEEHDNLDEELRVVPQTWACHWPTAWEHKNKLSVISNSAMSKRSVMDMWHLNSHTWQSVVRAEGRAGSEWKQHPVPWEMQLAGCQPVCNYVSQRNKNKKIWTWAIITREHTIKHGTKKRYSPQRLLF